MSLFLAQMQHLLQFNYPIPEGTLLQGPEIISHLSATRA